MRLGLKNDPSTYQRAMDITLLTIEWHFALVYLEDVVIFSRSVEEILDHLRTILGLDPKLADH